MSQTVMLIEGAATSGWDIPATPDRMTVISFDDLTLSTLKLHLPDVIILPLIGPGFDALDALARLAQLGFAGPVAVTTPTLPNPRLITQELSGAAPGMTVTLWQTNGQPGKSR